MAGRFDHGESLRIVFALLVAASSGLLWGHYQRIYSYGSPLGPFFAAAFAMCGALGGDRTSRRLRRPTSGNT